MSTVTIDVEMPDDGEPLHFRVKGDADWNHGVVDFCWLGIEPAIKLTSGVNLYPTMGDEWLRARAP